MSATIDFDLQNKLIQIRRDLHRNPELKYSETRTASIAAEHLRSLGLKVQTGIGRTGVVGLLETGRSGKTVLVRADMDALPVQEENEVDYGSQQPGKMHACGHDGHVAIAMMVAEKLAAEKESLTGNIKFVFQPAEEGGNGALAMIDDGVLENPKVDATFGLHLWNGMDVGQIGVYPGSMMASVDEFEIIITGKGGHGAIPQQTIDAIVVGSQIVNALQTIVSRNVDPLEAAVVTIGTFNAGTAFNVISESARLTGTVRTFSRELWEEIPNLFQRIVKGVCDSMGAMVAIHYERLCMPTINDPKMAGLAHVAAAAVVGEQNVISTNAARTMAGEDMSSFLEKVPGCFFFVGCRNASKGFIHPHHSPKFDIDEDALPIGLEIMTGIVRQYLSQDNR
jgi:amidohydrolase